MQLAENTVVAGRFRLISLLGRGGMGSVWRATHLGLDIPCAVKFIEGELATVPEAQARFEREAKAAAQLRSPHVVQILDHGVCEGTPYIAMELLEGEDLGKRLARVGRLSARDLYTVMSQVCRALARAHAVGIVHRDLKPDNIFMVKDDDREIVKVLDFGIAKSQSMELSTGNNTKTGALLGTPYYMSPEQAQGIKQVDFRTDLWALAVICFQALTGRLPFESDALGDLLVRIIVAPLPVPSQVGPVPPGFDAWWAKASSRDPRGRFESAKELSDSLALVCGVTNPGPPIESATGGARVSHALTATTGGVGSPMARTIDPVIPKRSLGPAAAIIGGVVAVAVLGGGFAFWQSQRGGAAPAQASAARNPAETTAPTIAPPPPAVSIAAPPVVAPEPEKVAPSPSASVAPPAQVPAGGAVGSPHGGPKVVAPSQVVASPPPPSVVSHPSAGVSAPARPAAPASEAKPGKPAYDVGF